MGGNAGIAILGLAVLYAMSKKNGDITITGPRHRWTPVDPASRARAYAEAYPGGPMFGFDDDPVAEENGVIITGPRHRIKRVDPASRARAYAEAYPGGPMFGFDEPTIVKAVKRIRYRVKPVIPAERAVAYEKAYGPMVGFDE